MHDLSSSKLHAIGYASLLLLALGCGQAPPETKPAASAPTTSTSNEPVGGAASAAEDKKSETTATAEVSSTAELSGPPAAATRPESTVAPTVTAKPNPTTTQAAKPQATKPPAAPAAPPKASPEQIAKWALPKYQPMKLLACYDTFGDGLLRSAAIAPEGNQFAVGGVRLTIWSFAESKPQQDIIERIDGDKLKRPVGCMAYSPDGKLLAAGDQQGNVRLFASDDFSKVTTITAHQGRLTTLAFSPDSKKLATTSYAGEIRVWELPDGKPLKEFKASKYQVNELLFLNNEELVVGSDDTGIWNVTSASRVSSFTKDVRNPAIALSPDRKWLAYNDEEDAVQFWDVEKKAVTPRGAFIGGKLRFSADGSLLASIANGAIFIWDWTNGQLVQVIDSPQGSPVEMAWLPGVNALMTVSEYGRIRLWGQQDDAAKLKLTPLEEPAIAPPGNDVRVPYTSEQFARIIDLRSFPALADAVRQFQQFAMVGYQTTATKEEAALFYRVNLSAAGWSEVNSDTPQGLAFTKSNCHLSVIFSPAYPDPRKPAATNDVAKLQVSLNLSPNVDVRLLPKFEPIASQGNYDFYSSRAYRTRADITDIEVDTIKQLHALGWTPYTRLDAGGAEEPEVRHLSFLQNGCELKVMISRPADTQGEYAVQTYASAENKSIAIPRDSGWIEFDSSTSIKMVATTKMSLTEAAEYYNQTMAAQGWLARPSRAEKDEYIGLPFIRGGQEVVVRLYKLPDGKTRVMVGDVENLSWQLAKPPESNAKSAKPGIEAADYKLPEGAKDIKYDVDEKNIEFTLDTVKPTALGEQFAAAMTALGWKQDGAGIKDDEYTLLTFVKDKAEINLRARGQAGKTMAMVGGDGMLWTKPLPSAPVRISYQTWLRRGRHPASLDTLDAFHSEMKKIAVK